MVSGTDAERLESAAHDGSAQDGIEENAGLEAFHQDVAPQFLHGSGISLLETAQADRNRFSQT
jgi:hypothetical protein